VSADFETELFKGYSHKDCVHVVLKGDLADTWNEAAAPFGSFTPEMVRQLQSITDRWAASKAATSTEEPAAKPEDEPGDWYVMTTDHPMYPHDRSVAGPWPTRGEATAFWDQLDRAGIFGVRHLLREDPDGDR
jgi:hypothetical protein